MRDEFGGAKFDDARFDGYANQRTKTRLFGLSYALKAPRRKLTYILVPFIVSSVPNATGHTKSRTPTRKHSIRRVHEKWHSRIRHALHRDVRRRVEPLFALVKLPKDTKVKSFGRTHESHSLLHRRVTRPSGVRRRIQRIHQRSVPVKHRQRLIQQLVNLLPRTRPRKLIRHIIRPQRPHPMHAVILLITILADRPSRTGRRRSKLPALERAIGRNVSIIPMRARHPVLRPGRRLRRGLTLPCLRGRLRRHDRHPSRVRNARTTP
mmetsp:Transcript_8651/g.32211  ORF Transcript_8651/g.32211 Transcript_8651/m.32211 type:complete len:265 (+) Transcript_8651:380-1174(+)